MNMSEIKDSLSSDVASILSSEMKVSVVETKYVPKTNDPQITFPNLDTNELKCKVIDTTVLYIDIRRSTELNLHHKPMTVSKLYSAFVRSMNLCARHFGGHVRGIIGDRVMVVFDTVGCFTAAVDTAVLMNSCIKYIINPAFPHNEVTCGIGIDYGRMLVTKTGIRKHGIEAHQYRNLVWLGRPANIASKLTDQANKTIGGDPSVMVAYTNASTGQWDWFERSLVDFIGDLEPRYAPSRVQHKHAAYGSFFLSNTGEGRTPPILMTGEVLDGLKKENPTDQILTKSMLLNVAVDVPGYSKAIVGGDVFFTIFR